MALYRAAVPVRPLLRCQCRVAPTSSVWRQRLYSTSPTSAGSPSAGALQQLANDGATQVAPHRPPLEVKPALKRLLRGGERPVPMPYSEAMAGQKLVAVPVKEGEEPLYLVAPDDLPAADRPWVRWAVLGFLFFFLWAVANVYLANNVKLNSSVVQTLIYNIRTSPLLAEELGRNIRPVPFFLEVPRIQGEIALTRGIVDISFDISGTLGDGKVIFTSVRREEGAHYEIVRWKVVLEDGRSINLKPELEANQRSADEEYEAKLRAKEQAARA